MKRLFSTVLVLLTVSTLFSCKKRGEVEPTDTQIKSNVSELTFKGDGDAKPFAVQTKAAWTAEVSEAWLELDEKAATGPKTVIATASPNEGVERSCTIHISLVSNPSVTLDIPVRQSGKGEPEPEVSSDPSVNPDISQEPEEPGEVIPRERFDLLSTWGVTGTLMGHNWGLSDDEDIPMYEDVQSGWTAAFDIDIAAEDLFKFRKDGAWDLNLGAGAGQPSIDRKYALADNGGNFQIAAGKYDFYIHPSYMILYVEKAGDEFAHGDAKGDRQEGENVRIYVLNNSTWDTPYMYAYAGGGGYQPYGSWPGTYASGTKVIGEYTYTYWEASGFTDVSGVSLILNDGGSNQYPAPDTQDPAWSNLTVNTTMYFAFDGKSVSVIDDPAAPGVSGKGIEPKEIKFGTSSWTIIGTLGSTNWDYDFPMDTEGYWEVAKGVSIAAGEKLKFRQNRTWSNNLGLGAADTENNVTIGIKMDMVSSGGNMVVATAGEYDIYLAAEKKIAYILAAGTAWTHEAEGKPEVDLGGDFDPDAFVKVPSDKASGLTYQVNVFSFRDSNGDGYGDFNGITEKLDYFDRLGVTGLWLSPIQPAQSYHGYDVTDYETVNPRFGTEADFQKLVSEAHKHNIRIYLDYVINHSGDQNKWFLDVKKNGTSSPYWNYYSLSKNPQADVAAGKIPQANCGYDSGKWFPVLIGGGGKERLKIELDWSNASAPTMTVSKTTDAVTSPSASHNNPARYLFWGSSTYTQFADNGTNKYVLVLDFESSWGCLIRTTKADDWSKGTKWGFNKTGDQLQYGVAHTLYQGESDDVLNIVMPGGDMYYYYTEFGTGMFVDFDYGKSTDVASSAAFKAVVGSAEKWLKMGVDGFRLDAVKHIYCNETGPENKAFWKAFYSACNKIYKDNASSRTGLSWSDSDIFMVGEVLSGDGDCTPFYQCLPALFEFQFWWDLRECLGGETIWNAGYGQNFPQSLPYRWYNHKEQRTDAIATPKLANHDEDRTASTLGNYKPKIRLAAAVLLTAAGRPYIYQGEELGYWGTKAGGDEYVRTPIMWTSSQSSAASKGVSNKVDWNMLTSSISVESQSEDETSLLTLYRHFAYARNINPALADGYPEADERSYSGYDGHVAGWYLHANDGSGKVVLVLHNFSSHTTGVVRWPGENVSSSNILVANGKVTVSGNMADGATVTLPGYSSVVFALN
ncbi:MAG: starch-binding protein [Bacteroidales bacterium]|nr:starch-binding protein [Bacteroidales bacterium]